MLFFTKGTTEPEISIYKTPPQVGEGYEVKNVTQKNLNLIEGYEEGPKHSHARDLCEKYPLSNE